MKLWMCGLFFSTISLFATSTVNDSVVKIYSTAREFNYQIPWCPPITEQYYGSGFVIEGNLILTNAHVVADASFIEVQSATSNERYEAFVKVIGHDCDLAILEVEDPDFFIGKEPLTISNEIARQEDEVQVYGFPMGGNGLSVTRGIISRIELHYYVHAQALLLISQIDAPINPGNSGGPVMAGGEVVGVAHQGALSGQNLGYMIPIPIIQHFLKDAMEGNYQGFPESSLKLQLVHNPAMREYYGLDPDMGGMLVTYIPENYFLYDVLQPGDVILSVDGHELDRFGYIELEELSFNIPYKYLIIMKYFGDQIDLEVLRDGEFLLLSAQIDHARYGAPLVGPIEFDKPPTYYILGGMVFQPLVGNLVSYDLEFDGDFHFVDLFYEYLRGKVEDGRDEVVILMRVLSDVVNSGYQDLETQIVKEVNGRQINNMLDLIDAFESCQDPYYIIRTNNDTEIILDREKVKQRSSKILHRYFISSDRSADLL